MTKEEFRFRWPLRMTGAQGTLMCNRLGYWLLRFAALLLCTSILPSASDAQTFRRLPAIYPVAQLERLPSVDVSPAVNGSQLESNNRLHFAGGSIEFQVPNGWWADEVPCGREMRVIVAPQRPANTRKMPTDGMWMAYRAATPGESQDVETLSRALSQRLRMVVASDSQFSPPTPFQFGAWSAAVAEFTSNDPTAATSSITGRHVMVRTDRGVFEFHASAPNTIVESRSSIWTATWDSLRLNPPTAETIASVPSGLSEANTIIGDWKSYRSRMRFSSDGRVVIVPDNAGSNQSSNPLTGTFEVRDDLIFVRWDDGSRLNFRSRLQGNDLFLTDHVGQISHLKRVFN